MNNVTAILFILRLSLLLLLTSFSAFAKQTAQPAIALSELGAFKTEFNEITKASYIEGAPILGKVVYKPKSAFKVALPFTPSQIVFSKVSGQQVKKGEVIAKISGLEVEHFLEELETAQAFYLQSKKHLEATKNYANDNIIKREEWLALNKTYLDAKLNFEHLSHTTKQLNIDNDGNSYLISPEDGGLNILNDVNEALFEVIPQNSIFVKTATSTINISNLIGFNVEEVSCQLAADFIEPKVENTKQVVWSQFNSNCRFSIGTQLTLTPIYKADGYSISQRAIFEIDNQNYVAVRKNQQLDLASVNIVGKENSNYVVQSANLTEGSQVLVSSVSAVQGIILGLGD